MFPLLRSAGLATMIIATLPGFSQEDCPAIVDITIVPNQSAQLEVWLRPLSDFENVFSSISFTIRWMDGEANLGSVSQEMSPYHILGTSGPEHVDGIYRYQVYAGFGFSNLNQHGVFWNAGEEVLLTRIDVLNGNSYFQISDDAFTASLNGLFFVSLNGEECPGEIYTFSTGGVLAGTTAPEITVSPNPTSGNSFITTVLEGTSDLHFELFDPAGRRIWQRTRAQQTGRHVEDLAMGHLADGVYVLTVAIGDRITTHRIVVASGK